ncbi:MAG: TFIIB-type zinc ribbon-containing protein [Coriobacteriia bacterium]|nr:TFIIB-type zinc ribbon-containing protein [Coriobacteriia bacterium]
MPKKPTKNTPANSSADAPLSVEAEQLAGALAPDGTPLELPEEPFIIDSNNKKRHGLSRCPRCGSADILQVPGTGRVQCQYCRYLFDAPEIVAQAKEQVEAHAKETARAKKQAEAQAQAVAQLTGQGEEQAEGQADEQTDGQTEEEAAEQTEEAAEQPEAYPKEIHYSGAADIDPSVSAQVTIKCQGCGAEVVIDTNESMTARCHWCRQILSIEHQIPNGAVPDALLPFHLTREQARESINTFVKKRNFFANKNFKAEFSTDNVLGVYLPYFVLDASTQASFAGTAGRVARRYTRGSGQNQRTYYDIDLYQIARDFDLTVSGLTLEARSEKRNISVSENTNNILNTIMPFDVENVVPYDGNYLKGFTSERRDTNIDDIKSLALVQIRDIARYQANATTTAYNAGIRWEKGDVDAKNTVWRTAYLPVWLYSYLENKSNGSQLLHYVAVNARTGETMGSVPVAKGRLFLISLIIELIAIPLGLFIMFLIASA